MTKSFLLFPVFLVLAACAASAPSEADYFTAVEQHWPNAQAEWKSKVAFYGRQAEGFRKGAELRRNVSASLGRKDDGASTDATAQEAETLAQSALWLSEAKLTSVQNIRCAPANALPGENCEMEITVTGTDGEEHKMGGAWRFDSVDGVLTIVDMIQK